MGAETIGGHIVRSLETSLDRLREAEKKNKDAVEKEGDRLMDELDRLTALMGGDAPKEG